MPQASVVVPWWDHTELLDFWSANLAYLDGSEVIFIDNGSAPDGQQQLAAFCAEHEIKLIRNSQNRGYAAANNQGAAIASGEHILFLNNDVEILKPPIAYLCEQAGRGIAGPGPLQTETREYCVEGWALCIHAAALAAIGGWCEAYGPGYWDDVDLCLRAKQQGYPIVYLEDFLSEHWTSVTSEARRQAAWIRHLGGTTGTDGRLNHTAINQVNRSHFTRKFYPFLRDVNLIIFPDWSQSEPALCKILTAVITTFLHHPDQIQMSLLVDPGEAGEAAELLTASVLMELLLTSNLTLDTEPAITVLAPLNAIDWAPIHSRLSGRLRLPQENAWVERASDLPAFSLVEFAQMRLMSEGMAGAEL